MDRDEKPLEGLGRYVKTSKAALGLLARFAGEKYLGLSFDQEHHAQQLTDLLSQLKGPAMKMGQILATVPDMVPEAYFQEFLQLQSTAPPMGWGFVRRRMRSELGEDWEDRFQSFERTAAAAASLGQVHRATALDGRKLACKLQYPDMETAIEADLQQLRLVCGVYERTGGAIKTDDIQTEIRARLLEELDYHLEATHIQWFRTILEGEDRLHLPQVIPELSTKRLLTMTWLDGESFLTAKDAPQGIRNQLGEMLFRAWYKPFYHYGMLHADPHLGNYTVRLEDGPHLNLLDFGCIRVFDPTFVQGVVDLYHGLLKDDEALRVKAYEAWGFTQLSTDLLAALNHWATFLYGPLLEDRVRPIDETFSGNPGREVAGLVHETLRKQGGIRPPRAFVFMDRAAVGIGSALIHLKAYGNWHTLFHQLIDGFEVKALADRQNM